MSKNIKYGQYEYYVKKDESYNLDPSFNNATLKAKADCKCSKEYLGYTGKDKHYKVLRNDPVFLINIPGKVSDLVHSWPPSKLDLMIQWEKHEGFKYIKQLKIYQTQIKENKIDINIIRNNIHTYLNKIGYIYLLFKDVNDLRDNIKTGEELNKIINKYIKNLKEDILFLYYDDNFFNKYITFVGFALLPEDFNLLPIAISGTVKLLNNSKDTIIQLNDKIMWDMKYNNKSQRDKEQDQKFYLRKFEDRDDITRVVGYATSQAKPGKFYNLQILK